MGKRAPTRREFSTNRSACFSACRSEPQMPHASVLTSTSPGPGSGAGISATTSFLSRITVARMGPPSRGGVLRPSRLLVEPHLLVEHLELGLVDVVLHPRLRDLVEGRAGDGVPVQLVDREFLELPGDGFAL